MIDIKQDIEEWEREDCEDEEPENSISTMIDNLKAQHRRLRARKNNLREQLTNIFLLLMHQTGRLNKISLGFTNQ